MNLFRYRKATHYEVKRELEKGLELNDYQKSKIGQILEDMPFGFIEFTPSPKPKLIHRLTAPFYFIFWLSLVLFMPFKWLFTGNLYYNPDKPIFIFLKDWYKLLGF